MTFDEQLRRAFETVTDRLRDETARHVKAVVDELSVAAEADRKATALDARDAATRDAEKRLEAAVAAAEKSARESGREDGRQSARVDAQREAEEREKHLNAVFAEEYADLRSGELAASKRLVDAVRSIERASSLSEILDTLLSCAGREAPRVAVLLFLNGRRFRGWRFIGFGPSFDEADRIEFGADEAGIISEAVRTAAPARADGSDRASAPSFAALPPGRESFAVPMLVGGQVVAVLYGDQGSASAVPHPDSQSRIPNSEPLSVWCDRVEIFARHAARCLEAQTALKAARVLTERPEFPNPRPRPDVNLDDPSGDDDAAARRYARLLVSEIKLYHEADVVAGRRDRDLATRLGSEIARARVLYEQRVAPHVRQGADHFHLELVQTLANGDETLLELRNVGVPRER